MIKRTVEIMMSASSSSLVISSVVLLLCLDRKPIAEVLTMRSWIRSIDIGFERV